ncbi:GatB/YqeY domain-containing protein [Patescibacteria group bacterium]|nr:GatB/YqeY domain-containing protein [Patescibacteria group bacterium]
MTLQEQIKENMKNAMKEKNMAAVTTYRGLMSAMTNEVVAAGKTPDTPVDDEMAMTVLTREAKKRKDAIAQYTDAGRPELAADEQGELDIIQSFLPELMSRDEIKSIAEAKMADMGIADASGKGQLMGALMGELKGKADGGDVKSVVDELLS